MAKRRVRNVDFERETTRIFGKAKRSALGSGKQALRLMVDEAEHIGAARERRREGAGANRLDEASADARLGIEERGIALEATPAHPNLQGRAA